MRARLDLLFFTRTLVHEIRGCDLGLVKNGMVYLRHLSVPNPIRRNLQQMGVVEATGLLDNILHTLHSIHSSFNAAVKLMEPVMSWVESVDS